MPAADVSAPPEVSDLQAAELIGRLPAAMFLVALSGDGRFWFAASNQRHDERVGRGVNGVTGRTIEEVFPPDQARRAARLFQRCIAQRRPLTYREASVRGTARSLWDTRLFPILDGESRAFGLLGASIEVSDVIRVDEALPDAEQGFRTIFDHTGLGVAYVAADGRVTDVNDSLKALTAAPRSALIGLALTDLLHPDDVGEAASRLAALSQGRLQFLRAELRLRRGDGGVAWARITASAIRDDADQPDRFLVFFEDVTALHQAEARTHYLASFDPASGLLNRPAFDHAVSQALQRAEEGSGGPVVLAIGVDRIAEVRDTFGREVADQVIRRLAEHLREALGRDSLLARIGDELFAALLPAGSGTDQAIAAAQCITAALARPVETARQEILLQPTIGISRHPVDGDSADGLVRRAAAAANAARGQAANRFALSARGMEARAIERFSIEGRLRRAIEQGDIALVFQPTVAVDDLRLAGFEALARWHMDDGAVLPPSAFIPIAEQSGLIEPLGECMLRLACERMAAWRRQGLLDVPMAVNLSGRQIGDPRLGQRIRAIVEASGLPPANLMLELTETSLLGDTPTIRRTLRELSEFGVRFALDDFGTGYSSLTHVKRFPINVIKIDKSFVDGMVDSPDDAAIVQAIIAMAHALKRTVVAEGVEAVAQLALLKTYRCDRVQGYLVAEPLTAAEVERRALLWQEPMRLASA